MNRIEGESQQPDSTDKSRQRLTPQDRSSELLPLLRARQLTDCAAYWLPVKAFPTPAAQRSWLLVFLERLSNLARDQFGLREEIFLQMKATLEENLGRAFFGSIQEYMPIPGLSRQPGTKPPSPPSSKDLEDMQAGRRKFQTNDFIPDYCNWFASKISPKIREQLFGYGAMTIGFLKPDPSPKPPAVPNMRAFRENPYFKRDEIVAKLAMAYSLKDPFLAKSKELFGADLAEDILNRNMLFVLPRIGAQDFFARPKDEVQKWFELFPIYLNESAVDGGLVLGSSFELDDFLIEMLSKMRADGLEYPEK